jgi:predicted Zn-dependent peptidase
MRRSIELVKQEMQKLIDNPLGARQLSSSKEQILGQIAMAEENNVSFMIMMARNLLDQGRVTSLEEIFERVKNTTAHQLQELAHEMFNQRQLSTLIIDSKK